jgi:ribonuclease BN (tRNA processing enzyme)
MPQPDRACSGYLLNLGSSLTLLDCGSGVCSSFPRYGFDPLLLDHIFITHTHSDHVGDLPLLLQLLYQTKRTTPLHIYVPDEFVASLRDYLNAVYMIREKFAFDWFIHGYSVGPVYDSDFSLRAIATTHMTEATGEAIKKLGLPNKMQCHAFRLEVGGRKILYSGDLGSFDDIADQLGDIDYCFVETTHVAVSEIIAHALKSQERSYFLTHLGNSEEVESLRSEVELSGLTNIQLVHDGLTIQL